MTFCLHSLQPAPCRSRLREDGRLQDADSARPLLHGRCWQGRLRTVSLSHRSPGPSSRDLANCLFRFGPYKNIKVRFAGTVLPGETLVTEMWKEGNKVIFQAKVKETGKLAIGGAAAELVPGAKGKM